MSIPIPRLAESCNQHFIAEASTGGEGANSEQLLAAGCSACFLGGMKFVAARDNIAVPTDVSIHGSVGIGAIRNGLGTEVDLKILLPGMPREAVRGFIDNAHLVCPARTRHTTNSTCA